MIARNPANHDDKWLVSRDYFEANFEPMDAEPTRPVESEGAVQKVVSEAARFRRVIRGALAPFWRSNPGVGDQEIVNAVGRAVGAATSARPVESELVEALDLPGHRCETILDLSRYMLDGSEVGGHSRVWKIGRLLESIEGAPNERWCFHIRTAWKPEVVFGFNEADLNYLAATAYAALGYHTAPDWIEAIVGGQEGAREKPEPTARPTEADLEAFVAWLEDLSEWVNWEDRPLAVLEWAWKRFGDTTMPTPSGLRAWADWFDAPGSPSAIMRGPISPALLLRKIADAWEREDDA
jgi:hypothetical protein